MARFQYFDRPALDVIRSRVSVRTYTAEMLSAAHRQHLRDFARNIKAPFANATRLEFLQGQEIARTTGKIGTYGVIRGAVDYIAGIVEKGENDLEQLGFTLEMLILGATAMGLGTCWLGGTFRRSQLLRLVDIGENEIMPAITPVGYPASSKSTVESLMRLAARSHRRKPWSLLFFDEEIGTPLEPEAAGEYRDVLEAVRLAPSASNKQPWRILRQGNAWHFYLKPTPGYAAATGYNLQRLDMGIAMCHFEMVQKERGLSGQWSTKEKTASLPGSEYTVSWVQ
jgi:nitroreductase